MAWETLAVVAGEIKSESEARQNQIGYDWTYGLRAGGSDNANTGDYAAYTIGPGDGLGVSLASTSWTTLRVGYWFKTRGWFNNATFAFITAHDGEDNQAHYTYYVILDWDTYQLKLIEYDYLLATATLLDSSNDVTPILGDINDWKHIAFYHNNSTNALRFWVNGVLHLSGTLTVTAPTHTIYAAAHGFFGDAGGYPFVDDLYFDYSTSSESIAVPPARRYYPALPDGAGNYTQWTPTSGNNYQNVDDPTDPDDDTTTVTSSSSGDIDTYTFSAVSIPNEADPESAVVQAYVRTSPIDGGVANLKLKTRLGGTDLTSSAQRIRRQQASNWYPNPTTFRDWTVITGFFDSKPTGGEWSETDFNNAEFGIESDGLI